MPYISQEIRKHLPDTLCPPRTAGELNYAITILMGLYLRQHGLNYQHINDCIGALEGAKSELYRRVVGPYEDIKILKNGDVYPEDIINALTLKE